MAAAASLASAALALALGRPPLVVPASSFAAELSQRTVTASTFAGVPLASHDSVTRAKVLTAFARRCDEESNPGAAFEDAVAGLCVGGTRRTQDQAEYDWSRDGRRVACKSAQLSWARGNECWKLTFQKIKLRREGAEAAAFDELLLAVYSPAGVHLFRHDLRAGVGSHGKETAATGSRIQFYGPTNEPDWRAALDVILEKMRAGTVPLCSAGFDDPRLAEAMAAAPLPFTASAYEGVPLADCSASARGKLLQGVMRRLDEGWLHPGAAFEDAEAGERVDGKRRGQGMAEYDWSRDGRRVACKGAQLAWERGKKFWKLTFSNVQLRREGAEAAAFDELLLAVYSPAGVHLFRHDLRAGVSSHGKETVATGSRIHFVGPMHEPSWRAALDVILEKMEDRGCQRLAFVPWEAGGHAIGN